MLTILLNRSRCCTFNHGTADDQLQWTRYRGKRSRVKRSRAKVSQGHHKNKTIEIIATVAKSSYFEIK